MRAVSPPSDDILQAFGTSNHPVGIVGGQGLNFRSGNVVLKPAQDDEETNWIAEFYLAVEGEGFRVPKPIRAQQGRFVYNGWQAWEFIEGCHESGRWEETIDLCIRFHQAIANYPRPAYFDRREQNPWVIADKVAWGEMELKHHYQIRPSVEKLMGCLGEVRGKSQLIHGDFGGNILFATDAPPAIIDFSPYWRPVEFAIGIIVADAIVWEGGSMALIESGSEFPGFYHYLARAELRRVIEIETLYTMYGWEILEQIEAHLPLIDAIVERCG